MPECGSHGRFVSLDDAERTIKTGQPPEMRMEVSATATAPQPAKAAVAAAAAAVEPARAAPARPGAPQQNGPAAEPSKVLVNASQCSAALVQQAQCFCALPVDDCQYTLQLPVPMTILTATTTLHSPEALQAA